MSVQVMPYEDAKTYCFNPFDLTKTWSKKDYPLIEVGELELNKNPDNFFGEIEQAAFAPSNIVPGIGFSPTRCCWAACSPTRTPNCYRIGANFHQLPVNQPIAMEGGMERANQYMFDGQMAFYNSGSAPVYAPNSFGRPYLDWQGTPAESRPTATWSARRTRCTPRTTTSAGAGTLVREVFDDAARDRLVDTVSGALTGVEGEVLKRALEY